MTPNGEQSGPNWTSRYTPMHGVGMPTNSNPRWFFVKQDPNDRIRATARRHSLGGTKLSPESRLAREVIQNSVDATLPNKKTSVLIWNKVLSGQEVLTFRNLIGFKDSDSPFSRLNKLGLKVGNAYTQMKSKAKSPSFSVTIVEDRNTCGLCYDEPDGKDRFDELCLSYGQDSTAAAAERGGSYGFGKGVYEESSDCNTFIVYSVYEPNPNSPSDPGSHARLFGCATFDGHTVGNTSFKGRALFGVYEKRQGQTECRPILDADAHRIARQLGFLERGPTEYGTSIMIIGSTIELDALRAAVEDYWWQDLLQPIVCPAMGRRRSHQVAGTQGARRSQAISQVLLPHRGEDGTGRRRKAVQVPSGVRFNCSTRSIGVEGAGPGG